MLAARGARNMDGGEEPVADAGERRRLRDQAVRVHAWALLMAATLTALSLIPPV